jgi:tetratricopeptide (TPR) repeat protein
LVYRGVAHRYADALDLASQDIEQAKALAPTRADIWLERGILQQLRGNLDRAREDFIEALSLTDDLHLQQAIRDRIELMDLS